MARNWLLIISFFFFGCTHSNLSQDLLPRETFKKILIDIDHHKKDSVSSQTIKDSTLLLKNVLNQHGVSDTLYQRTLIFYVENPKEMVSVLKEVEAYLK